MARLLALLASLLLVPAVASAQSLRMYFIDVEGGQATLIVTPAGQSMLVDTGWPGFNGRDADRIAATLKRAGVSALDYLVITHYHDDHVGGMEQLAARVRFGTVFTHGPTTETGRMAVSTTPIFRNAMAATGAKEIVLKPGDAIPLEGVDVTIISSNRELIAKPLPGAGARNPACDGAERRRPDTSDNSASVGMLFTFGSFRFLDLGDVTQDLEFDLACPVNRLGEVDLYLTTHHGSQQSNAQVLVHALNARVAIMNNGARKGGDLSVLETVRSAPGLEDLWMLHHSVSAGAEGNVTEPFIANLGDVPDPAVHDSGFGIDVTVQPDGTYTVVNRRNNLSKTYSARKPAEAGGGPRQVPHFRVDPAWPKPLPNRWIIGAVAGVAVDQRDHVWIVHRPSTLQPNETRSIWKAAPPVLEFDPDGNLVSAWGGPGDGYEWPELEHGIFVDDSDNVWLGGGGNKDAHILKFDRGGKFLMQIGRQGKGGGSNDTANLGAPANMFLDASASELYVADGYVNHRVIVLDAATGKYKRHWGAYGKRPDDSWFTQAGEKLPGPFAGAVQHENRPSQYDPSAPPAPQFRIVHAVRISKDGLVYVCDRTNNRLQVFRKDGSFVREVIIAKETFGSGSVWDVGFSTDPQQAFLFINDGTNQLIYVLDRQTLQVVSTFGGAGRWAGQFYGAHNLAVNARGDLFVTETYEGKRVQKFTYTGLGAPSAAP